MAGIGIIHNPFAKGNLKRPGVGPKVKKLVEEVGVFRETRNINELPRVAEEFLEQGIDTLAVNGGDGTLHIALTAFVKVYGDRPLPRIMSLRGGTMNTMSNSLKIKGRTLSIMEKAVKKYAAGESFNEREQHLIKVNDMYGFMTGGCIIAKFLDLYYSGASTGPWHAAKLINRALASAALRTRFTKDLFRPTPSRVKVNGRELDPEEYTVILGCTIRELGLGFTPTPRAYDKPGHFHMLAADINPYAVIPRLPSIWLGRDLEHKNIQHTGPAKEAVVEPRGMIRWMIDGEVYDADKPLHLSVGPTVTVAEP